MILAPPVLPNGDLQVCAGRLRWACDLWGIAIWDVLESAVIAVGVKVGALDNFRRCCGGVFHDGDRQLAGLFCFFECVRQLAGLHIQTYRQFRFKHHGNGLLAWERLWCAMIQPKWRWVF